MLAVEDGAFALDGSSVENFIDGARKADDEPAVFEQLDITRVFDGAAAGGNDDAATFGDFDDGLTFEPTKMIFAVRSKDIGNGHFVIGFDFLIEIDEGATEFSGEHFAEGSFAGAHKTDKNEIIFQGERSFPDRKVYNIKRDINQARR